MIAEVNTYDKWVVIAYVSLIESPIHDLLSRMQNCKLEQGIGSLHLMKKI